MRAEQIHGGDRLYFDRGLSAKDPIGNGGKCFVVDDDPDYRKPSYGQATVAGHFENQPDVPYRAAPRDLHGDFDETNARTTKAREERDKRRYARAKVEEERRAEVDECVRRLSLLGVQAQVIVSRWGGGDGAEYGLQLARADAVRLAEALAAGGWPT